ncbi:MAG: hypothetical protein NZM38_08965 [Cytophagales bacterium]|nr:hypothetical protein [Cytophagales bacterium]MDW8384890.1 hypothetical protein [Flammeovirgaceae bacterium]
MKKQILWLVALIATLACSKKQDDAQDPSPSAGRVDTTLVAPSRAEQSRTLTTSVSSQQQLNTVMKNVDEALKRLNIGFRESNQEENCYLPQVVSRVASNVSGYDSIITVEYPNRNCQGVTLSGRIVVYFKKGSRWSLQEEIRSGYKDSVIFQNVTWISQQARSVFNGYAVTEVTGRRLIDSVFISEQPKKVEATAQREGYWLKRYAGTTSNRGSQTLQWVNQRDTLNGVYKYSGSTTYTADSVTYSYNYNNEFNKRKYTAEAKDILIKSGCHSWYPIKGTYTWAFTDKDNKTSRMIIDYGNGTCDRTYVITYADGTTETKEN